MQRAARAARVDPERRLGRAHAPLPLNCEAGRASRGAWQERSRPAGLRLNPFLGAAPQTPHPERARNAQSKGRLLAGGCPGTDASRTAHGADAAQFSPSLPSLIRETHHSPRAAQTATVAELFTAARNRKLIRQITASCICRKSAARFLPTVEPLLQPQPRNAGRAGPRVAGFDGLQCAMRKRQFCG